MRPPDMITDNLFVRAAGPCPEATQLAAVAAMGVRGLSVRMTCQTDWLTLPMLLDGLRAVGMHLQSLRFSFDVFPEVSPLSLPPHIVASLQNLVLLSPATIVELELVSSSSHDIPSAPRADVRAMQIIRHVLSATATETASLRVALAPMHGQWLCKIEDAVRLGMRLNQPRLGLSIHWLNWLNADGQQLEAKLELAIPRLLMVTLGGVAKSQVADASQHAAWNAVPLEKNEWNLAQLRATLSRMGFGGAVGLNPTAQQNENVLQAIEREIRQWKLS